MERGGHGLMNGTAMPPHADHAHYKAPASQCSAPNNPPDSQIGKDGRIVAVDVLSGAVLGVVERGGVANKVAFTVE